MKIQYSVLKVLVIVFVTLLLMDLLPDSEAAPAKRGKDGSKSKAKAKGRSDRKKGNQGSGGKRGGKRGGKGKAYEKVKYSETSCSSAKDRDKRQADSFQLVDVYDTLRSTVNHLEKLNSSLYTSKAEMMANSTIELHAEFGIRELNPIDTTRLASDKEFKLLGQASYLLNWIEVSLTFLQRRDDDLVPHLSTILEEVGKIQMLLELLRIQVDFKETSKGAKALKCQTVKVKKIDKSKERSRAYVIVRDSLRAVGKIHQQLSRAEAVRQKSRFSINNMEQSVFYKCLKQACDLRDRCKKCLQWE